MDINNPIVKLCMEGTRAEFEKRINDARILYQQAWDVSTNDYEACIAAHYVTRFQESPEETLRWNQLALEHADKVKDGSVKDFYPSLYVNLGYSHEVLGNQFEARKYYDLAESLGLIHNQSNSQSAAEDLSL